LGDDQPLEIKKPRKLDLFDIGPGFPAKCIIKVICGGMHTLALASDGSLYSWGCNDEGVLGRGGAENVPLRVDGSLDIPVTDISTGDSHAIAYNTDTNQLYYWGCYRVSKILPLPKIHLN
jgi:alpha-tubulin suppressor-like RCC1 family protein